MTSLRIPSLLLDQSPPPQSATVYLKYVTYLVNSVDKNVSPLFDIRLDADDDVLNSWRFGRAPIFQNTKKMMEHSYANGNWCEPATEVFLKIANFDDRSQTAAWEVFKGLGRMFYIVSPNDSTFEDHGQVPKYFLQAWPYFLLFMVLENVILWIDRQPTFRLNDGLTSISQGLIQETGRILFRGAESYAYIFIYENYHIAELPWNYPLTWYLAAVGVDFCYYWMHRACHEVSILWAQHQVHHSSEELNLAVGVRQSAVQGWCGFIFYLPLALIIPPAQFVTHQQFSLLYQFWIHTKIVKSLGPLEFVFNTPSHHRVHHGSNLYCLDKNYGGALIIWDRLFGTFAEEDKEEEIIYGLVINEPSFNPVHLQTFYTKHVIERWNSMDGWKLKLATIFYGPSWMPGRPRLGLDEDKIKVVPRKKYDVKISAWCNIYLSIHFCVVVYFFQELSIHHLGMNPISVIGFACYIIGSLTVIGLLFDNRPNACVYELIRCLLVVLIVQSMDFPNANNASLLLMEAFFLLSGVFWFLRSIKVLEMTATKRVL